MKTEPQRASPAKLLGGFLGLAISFGLVGGFACLVGVPWLYSLAFVVGAILLSAPLMIYSARRYPEGPPPSPGFSGPVGVVSFWVVGAFIFIPSFALVAGTLGQIALAPLLAAAFAPWFSPERTATAVLLIIYATSLVCGTLLWGWGWQQLKPPRGAA